MKITTQHPDGTTTEREVPDTVFSFREGDVWIAAWRPYDIVVQGSTEKEALERLVRTIGLQCLWDAIDGHKPFEGVSQAPPEVIAEWEARHGAEHGVQPLHVS